MCFGYPNVQHNDIFDTPIQKLYFGDPPTQKIVFSMPPCTKMTFTIMLNEIALSMGENMHLSCFKLFLNFYR